MGFAGMFLAGGLVSPGLSTALANVQPLVAAVLAYFILSETLSGSMRIALALGFLGIVLIALPGLVSKTGNSSIVGILYILMGAVGVALGNVIMKRLSAEVDPLMGVGLQFLLGSMPLFALSFIFEPTAVIRWSSSFIASLLILSLPGTAMAALLWFYLLKKAPLGYLNAFSFLIPVFGLLFGTILFGERLDLLEGGGVLLIASNALWAARAQERSPRES